MAADPGLDARLLVGAEDVVLGAEALALPPARVQVQDHPAFSAKRGSRGKIQYLYRQGLIASPIQDPPDGTAADRLAQGGVGPRGQVGQRLAAQGQFGLGDRLAGDGLDDRLIPGGKRPAGRPRPGPSSKVKSPPAHRLRQVRTELGWSCTRAAASGFERRGC